MEFIYALALELGYASPSRMLRELRPSELGLWIAKWRTDPWGDRRADIRQAYTSFGIHTAWLKKRSGNWTLQDFLPFLKKRAPASPKTAQQYMRERFGHMVTRKKPDDR